MSLLLGQQASSGSAPLFNANAKYVQGVGPGYWPTAGAGLTLNLAAGTAICGNPPALITYAGGTLALTASQTNYVYLDPAASCAPAFNTAGFSIGQIPLAKVVTGATTITTITDARTWFAPLPMGVSSAGAATLAAPLTANTTNSASQNIASQGLVPWWFNSIWTQAAPAPWDDLNSLGIGLDALDGGFNVNQNGQSNKTAYENINLYQDSHTPGEHALLGASQYDYSVGDNLGFGFYNYCWGGKNGGGDEGCEYQTGGSFTGNVEYAGTLTGSPATGATSITVSPTQGVGSQGTGRWLLDVSKAITGGTTSAIAWDGNVAHPPTVTISNAVASTVVGTLGTAVTLGATQTSLSATVTPTFSTGAISNITTSTVVLVADAGEIEPVIPSAVNTGAGTFTATFRKSHASTAIIAVGGLAGDFYSALADQLTNSSFAGQNLLAITGTLRQVWPIISCTSTVCQLWISFGGGEYQAYPGMAGASGGFASNNGHTIYPGAEITSVVNGGAAVSNTLTLAPNAVSWASGDTVTLPLYPVTDPRGGNVAVESFLPGLNANAQSASAVLTMSGIWTAPDQAATWVNQTPQSFYSAYGANTYQPPYGLTLTGPFAYLLAANAPSGQGIWFHTCAPNPATLCSAAPDYAVVQAEDGTGTGNSQDVIYFSPSKNKFYATANNGAATMQFVAAASLTTTAATSDNLAVQGATAASHCSLTATNASAATNVATTYVSAKTTNQITVTHTALASMTYEVLCTQN